MEYAIKLEWNINGQIGTQKHTYGSKDRTRLDKGIEFFKSAGYEVCEEIESKDEHLVLMKGKA